MFAADMGTLPLVLLFVVVVVRDLDSDPATFLARASDAEYQRQVATGYYRFDSGAGRYVPTLKGAYLMTWKLQTPWKQIRGAIYRGKARRLLRELEGPSEASWPAPAPRA